MNIYGDRITTKLKDYFVIHKIATALSISIELFDGFRTIFHRNVVGQFFEFHGQSAFAHGSGVIVFTIAWLICWHTNAIKLTKDENWPYLIMSNYLIAIIVKMVM